ncbi:hypothetical protein KJ836_03520 [Patescibacteria group bacterium]|nr:hypothetical protein [Patescibacteria group bacterium]
MKKLVKSLSYLLAVSLIVFLLPTNTTATTTPTYMYEWINQSGNISSDGLAHEYTNLQAGQTLQLSLTLKNKSGSTIRARHRLGNSPGKQVPVGSYGIGSQTPYQDGTPSFLDLSSFVLNNNRFVYYDGTDVSPEGLFVMSWNIKLKENLANGVYNLYVRPVSEYNAWTRQSKNGKLLPDNNSDIFWRLVVGDGSSSYTPDGWSTYTDQHNYFSIQYPADWTYTLQPHMIKKNIVFSRGEGDIWRFFVTIEGTDKTLQENVDAKVIEEINNGYTVEKSNTTISGQPATTVHYYSTCCGGDYYETLVVYKDRLYALSPHGSGDNLLTTMFESFKLL